MVASIESSNSLEMYICIICDKVDTEMDTCPSCDNYIHGPKHCSEGGNDGCGQSCTGHCNDGYNFCNQCTIKWLCRFHCNEIKCIAKCHHC